MHFINRLITQYLNFPLMGKLGTNYILFGIAMATILGVFAMTTATDDTLTINAKMPQFLGHVAMTVTDSDGNIKSYIQSDNIVTDQGLQCALVALFSPTVDAECGNTNEPFNIIVLGSNSTDGPAAADDVTLDVTESEVARIIAEFIVQDGNDIILNRTFIVGEGEAGTGGLGELEVVGETALFDDAADNSGNMLARVVLPPTTVVDGDEIFIEWTITGSVPPPV